MKLQEILDSIDGWLSLEVACLLFQKASSNLPSGVIVEIGSWQGKSTVILAKGSLNGGNLPVIAIDPHSGSQEHKHLYGEVDTYAAFLKNLEKWEVASHVRPLKMKSEAAVLGVNDPVALLWIDGSHEYPDVKKDFDLWFPKLAKGAWILFHDSKWPGVKRVLWEDLYTRKDLGLIRRVEDTTYAQYLGQQNFFAKTWNELALKFYQWQHARKKQRRKRKKSIQ